MAKLRHFILQSAILSIITGVAYTSQLIVGNRGK